MRKAVFLNFPTHGCINSLLATASELVRRGEKIIYYCTEAFKSKIEQTGAEFRPYGGTVNDFTSATDDLFRTMKLDLEMTVDKLEHTLEAVDREGPDYVVHDSLCTWGKIIASRLRIPAVNLMHSFPVTRSSLSLNSDTAVILAKSVLYKIAGSFSRNSPLKTLDNRYGVRQSLRDLLVNEEGLNIVYTSAQMRPEIHRSEKRYRFVGPSLFFKDEESDFPFERLSGKEVIYISQGTLHNDNLPFYKTCLNAFGNRPYRVVISTGFAIDLQALGELPENVIVRPSVPQQKLLPHVSLFLTHAGMNSVNEAICSGIPMLLLPHQMEQKLIAQRVCDLGMGKTMNMKRINGVALRNLAEHILREPSFKASAEKYQAVFSREEQISHIRAAEEIQRYISGFGLSDQNR